MFIVILAVFGRPNLGDVIVSYLGMVLLGMLFCSIGLFFSVVTREQVVALLGAWLALAGLSFVNQLPAKGDDSLGAKILKSIGTKMHTDAFLQGDIFTSHIVYFVSGTCLFLFLAYIILESRRWR